MNIKKELGERGTKNGLLATQAGTIIVCTECFCRKTDFSKQLNVIQKLQQQNWM